MENNKKYKYIYQIIASWGGSLANKGGIKIKMELNKWEILKINSYAKIWYDWVKKKERNVWSPIKWTGKGYGENK